MHPQKLLSALLFILLIPILSQANTQPVKNTKINFFTKTLNLRYHPDMLKKNKHCTSSICLKRFYNRLEAANYQLILDDLLAHKESMNLNDWFFYQLIRKTVEQIYQKESDMFHTTTTWFLMTKAGYDTRLYTSKSKYTFLYVRTEDEVFEAPFVRIKDQPYVNLSSMYYGIKTKGIFFEVSRFQPGKANHKPFSFKIDQLPDLPPAITERTYQFDFNKEPIQLKVMVDTLSSDLLRNFPITQSFNYVKAPMSKTTMSSLKKALQPHLEGKTPSDQLRMMVSFTRKAFPYKNDQVRYRRDQPLTGDQLMLADSSDFEDRCALLYSLLKETTNLDFIVVRYIHDDIITIGVELPEITGKPFEHQDVQYTICDPTMPGNSSKLGIYPISLDKDIEILEVVHQQE